jgi:hypothetical protein
VNGVDGVGSRIGQHPIEPIIVIGFVFSNLRKAAWLPCKLPQAGIGFVDNSVQ